MLVCLGENQKARPRPACYRMTRLDNSGLSLG